MSLAIFSMATGGKRLGGDLDRDLYGNFMSKGLPTDVSACLIRRAQRVSQGSDDWEDWFCENRRWLAREFLRRSDKGVDIRPFFGSWLQIRGRSQTGYFLGSEIVAELEQELSFEEIAALADVSKVMTNFLLKYSNSG